MQNVHFLASYSYHFAEAVPRVTAGTELLPLSTLFTEALRQIFALEEYIAIDQPSGLQSRPSLFLII
jgi:hypothetical protein